MSVAAATTNRAYALFDSRSLSHYLFPTLSRSLFAYVFWAAMTEPVPSLVNGNFSMHIALCQFETVMSRCLFHICNEFSMFRLARAQIDNWNVNILSEHFMYLKNAYQ